MGSISVQKSWLEVALNDQVFSRKWVVLDNGVLWIHSDNHCSSFAEDVLPLQDVEVCCTALDAEGSKLPEATFAVRTGTRGLYLRAASENEYRRWIAAILEAARVWLSRRETASLSGQDAKKGYPRALSTPPECPLEELEECSKRVANCLIRLFDKCAELRQLTRKAVTQTDNDVLPRFHRRAVNDTVEKVWRASERARSALAAEDGTELGSTSYLAAVRALRDEVDAFVTHCNLRQDLQIMLNQVSGLDALVVIRQLSSVRAALRLRRPRGHEAAHAAGLVAINVILQKCWAELREQNSPICVGSAVAPRLVRIPPEPVDVMFLLQERQMSHPASERRDSDPGARRARSRMALRLKRDVSVSVSQRRARKRARSEAHPNGGMEMLPVSGHSTEYPTPDHQGTDVELLVKERDRGAEDGTQALSPDFASAISIPKYATLSKSRQAAVDTGETIPVRIRRKTYAASSVLDFNTDDDENEAFVEPSKPKEEVGERPNTPVKSCVDTPVTPATPNGGGRRALWCETMEVQQSGLLDRMSPSERALQEAKFEVLSSEESYLRSLDVLAQRVSDIDAFHDPLAITDHERDAVTLFLDSARACSLRFVSALRALWSRDILLRGLCALMRREATSSLLQYAVIVGMQPRAASVPTKIGSSEASQLVPLLSLPAQRATRLPLLLAAILRRLDQQTSEAVICRAALDRLNQIVFECNESQRRAEQAELFLLSTKLLAETPRKKTSWRERKSSVLGRAKSLFQKSSSLTSRTKARTSTSSLAPLAPLEQS